MHDRENDLELKLTSEEATLLHRVLANFLPELREEIYKTENFEWRRGLKEDEVLIKALLERLEATLASGRYVI